MSAYIGQQEETMNALMEGLKEYAKIVMCNNVLTPVRLKEDEVIAKQTLNSLVAFSKYTEFVWLSLGLTTV